MKPINFIIIEFIPASPPFGWRRPLIPLLDWPRRSAEVLGSAGGFVFAGGGLLYPVISGIWCPCSGSWIGRHGRLGQVLRE
jgi:hypothetical protein